MEVDLLEHYETLPKPVQDIIGSWDDNQSLYSECARIQKELIPYGYSCDYGLDGEIYDLTKISECDVSDWAMIKNWIVQDENVSSNYGVVMRFSEELIPNNTETNWYAHITLKNGESVTVNAHEITKLY